MKPLEHWVNDNNVDTILPKKNYSKGWWEYIDFIRTLSSAFNVEARVISSYEIDTPPPEEKLILPLILLQINGIDFYIKQNFSYSGFYDCWLVSVNFNGLNQKYCLRDFINDVDFNKKGFRDGFVEDSVITFVTNNIMNQNYNINKLKFTGTVESNFDVYTLLKVCISDIENKKRP
jgi:hypothetical protein